LFGALLCGSSGAVLPCDLARPDRTSQKKEQGVAIGQQTNGAGEDQPVQQKVQDAGRQAQEQAQQVAGQARDRIRGQFDRRSTDAGEQITSQASDIRTVADQLREQGKDQPAQLAEQAAQHTERVGSYLKESDADRILNDVEDFARQRPWAVVAGGVALGLAASRLLKASSADRHRSGRSLAPGTPPSPIAPTAQVTAQTGHGAAVDPALDDGRHAGMGSQ
jgi:F0F1-type ATP synthase membrane subunit b/b'